MNETSKIQNQNKKKQKQNKIKFKLFELQGFFTWFQGKSYINGTKSCLMKSLHPHVTRDNMTCEQLKNIAFETHADCYVENGFCEMLPSNILSMISVYDITNDFLFTKDFDLVTKQVSSLQLFVYLILYLS